MLMCIIVVVTEGFTTTLFGWLSWLQALHIRVTNHVIWTVVYKFNKMLLAKAMMTAIQGSNLTDSSELHAHSPPWL